MAWPKDSRPPKPISRLKAQAKSAKHITFIRNTGYSTSGASAKNATMTPKATCCARLTRRFSWGVSLLRSEQAGGPDQQDERHDDEDDGVRGLRIEHLRQALDHAEAEAGKDRAHDRAHAADHHHCEDDDDQVRSHLRADLVDR